MTRGISFPKRAALILGLVLPVSACETGYGTIDNLFRSEPRADIAAQPTLPRPGPDSRGVITYNSYQVMVARDGDTIASMAQRVGLQPRELAEHNGLPGGYRPRPGEVLALPRMVGGSPADNVWNPSIASSAIDSAPIGAAPIGTGPIAGGGAQNALSDNPFRNGQPDRVIDPIRHRVQAGETAFSIARRYGVSVTALASWNGLDREMRLRENQELLIPIVDQGAARVASANAPGTPSAIAPPPSAADALPRNQNTAAVQPPPSPNLAAATPAPAPAAAAAPAPAAPRSQFLVPVSGGKVIQDYDPSGPKKSEGIDYGAPAGTKVIAAADGEVALISEAVNSLGTIVLIRHNDNLITVYGRITDVKLKKGDRVSRGQQIGVIAPGNPPNLHFEVRRGTQSVDPKPFL